jgi:N-acetylmuramic acid 6-phosphate etherase
VPPGRYLARIAGGVGAFERAVEGAEDDIDAGAAAAEDLNEVDVAFGIAASGRTPWVIGALRHARERGAATISLACVRQSALALAADVSIEVDTGAEPIVGSTRMKAGTAQKMVLNAFSTALMVRLGKVYGNLMVDLQATNEKLRQRATRLVQQVAACSADDAREALAASSWQVKTAIAMRRLGVSADEARARLEQADGYLRVVLAEPGHELRRAGPASRAGRRPAG